MTKIIAIYGAGGFGREVLGYLRADADHRGSRFVFLSDFDEPPVVGGIPVISFADMLQEHRQDWSAIIAIADSNVRRRLHERCARHGIEILGFQAPGSMLGGDIDVGEGFLICPFALVTCDAKIGKGVHLNIHAYVAHDCRVGDFVTFAPRASCNGNVWIEDDVYVGAGAVIRNGSKDEPLIVGKGAVIGMGAVVIRSVPPGVVVAGNPARPIHAPQER